MGKLEYLDALKRAMSGLPPEKQAKTLAWYEQRFVDGIAAGRSEQDVANELDDPRKVALTLRASTHLSAFAEKKHPADLLRLAISGVGLLVFNLFMVVPAAVYTALLAALYSCALGFYIAGIAITASGLAGANEMFLDGPLRQMDFDGHSAGQRVRTRVAIGDTGIDVSEETAPAETPDGKAPAPNAEPATDPDADAAQGSSVIRGPEAVAEHGIQISTGMDAGSRTTQTFFGLGMVVGAIALFLLALVVTKYTLAGIRRYVKMNLALLKGE